MILSLLEHGGGFQRPNGDPDLATVIYQVYDWMCNNEISFYFNGTYYHWDYWTIFIGFIVFYTLIDIAYMFLYVSHDA